MDHIELLGLGLAGRHGVSVAERTFPQPFSVDVRLHCDLRTAAETDDLGDTVDYAKVADIAAEVIEGPPVCLLETLAERIAQRVLLTSAKIAAVEVAVRKLRPPLDLPLQSVGVRILRERK